MVANNVGVHALFDFAAILACVTDATILPVTNWGYITSATQATAILVNLTSILLFLFPVTCLFHLYLVDIANLRKKFDEDKKRIAEMKSARKFRPY